MAIVFCVFEKARYVQEIEPAFRAKMAGDAMPRIP